jgi:hypothetical protein
MEVVVVAQRSCIEGVGGALSVACPPRASALRRTDRAPEAVMVDVNGPKKGLGKFAAYSWILLTAGA